MFLQLDAASQFSENMKNLSVGSRENVNKSSPVVASTVPVPSTVANPLVSTGTSYTSNLPPPSPMPTSAMTQPPLVPANMFAASPPHPALLGGMPTVPTSTLGAAFNLPTSTTNHLFPSKSVETVATVSGVMPSVAHMAPSGEFQSLVKLLSVL